jgi:phosphatidate cytidylyltransferase
MLLERFLVGIIIIPLVLFFIIAGNWVFAAGVTLILGVAAWEYWRMVKRGGFKPSAFVLMGGVVLLSLSHYFWGFKGSEPVFSGLVLITMFLAIRKLEEGNTQPASEFAISLAGLVYLGWIGTYLVALRTLPDGEWWMLTALPAAWFGDIGAYFIGVRWGRHKFSPRVSPKKTWEGYLGGIPFSILGTMGLAAIWHLSVPGITLEKGALLGFVIGILSPLGDLGESMLKRQFGIKDTSGILPGHGGVMDRIDSSLWAAVIGYYLITIFML